MSTVDGMNVESLKDYVDRIRQYHLVADRNSQQSPTGKVERARASTSMGASLSSQRR